MVDLLAKDNSLELEVNTLKESDYASTVNIKVSPKYYIKRFYERFKAFVSKTYTNLSFWEIQWLKNNIDVVHLHHSFLFKYFGGISKINSKKRPKIIVTLRGSDTYLRPWYDERWLNFYMNSSDKIDAFVVMSEHQKKYLQKWGVAEDKIKVIPASIKSRPSEPKELKSGVIKIVSSFRMTWEKNIEGNLRVIRHLIDKGYKVNYDIYGRGHDIGELYFMIDKYNLHDDVSIKGKVENNEYLNLLKCYDFYLQLSKSESLSISTVEAQSLGLPAIISDSRGMPETILEGKSGFSVPFTETEAAAKKLSELIENKDVYVQFSKAAIKNANSKFTNKVEVDSYINLYKSLTENA